MSNIDELEKIQELKANGIITEEEFKREKAKILNTNVNVNSEKNIKEKQKKESKIFKNKEIKIAKSVEQI